MLFLMSPMPGTIVYVNFWGQWRHYGLVSERLVNGKPTIIASAFRTAGVREITWDKFAGGRQVFQSAAPSNLPGILAVHNARGMIGQAYELFRSNCEHFVHRCYSSEPKSAQAAVLGGLALTAGTLLVVGLASQS